MSTEIKTDLKEHTIIKFWGGDTRGTCLQITATTPRHERTGESYVQLSMQEAALLCNDLNKFVVEEAKRRQKLLKKQLAKTILEEKTVFNEVMELSETIFEAPKLGVLLVDTFCPITDRIEHESI